MSPIPVLLSSRSWLKISATFGLNGVLTALALSMATLLLSILLAQQVKRTTGLKLVHSPGSITRALSPLAFQSSETTRLSGTVYLSVHSQPVLELPGPTHFPPPTGRITQLSYLMLAPHLTQPQATLEPFQAFIVHTSVLMIPGTMLKSPSTLGTLNALTLLVITNQYLKVLKLTMKHARLLNSPMLTIRQLWPTTREKPIDF